MKDVLVYEVVGDFYSDLPADTPIVRLSRRDAAGATNCLEAPASDKKSGDEWTGETAGDLRIGDLAYAESEDGTDTPDTVAWWLVKRIGRRVCLVETGECLEGEPSANLVAESERAIPTGNVLAMKDVDGRWKYVPSSMESHYRNVLKENVCLVYIEECSR